MGSLSSLISNTDPGYPTESQRSLACQPGGFARLLARPLDGSPDAERSARFLNDVIRRIEVLLAVHPLNESRSLTHRPLANAILTRGPGCSLPIVEDIATRFHRPFVLLADHPIESGIGSLVGCDTRTYSTGGRRDATYTALARAVKEIAIGDTVVAVHVKGPDDYGHQGDYWGKVRCIEDIDRFLVQPLIPWIEGTGIMVATCDHATPCSLRTHSDDAVPFAIAGGSVRHNGSLGFNEGQCRQSKSSIALGASLLPYAFANA